MTICRRDVAVIAGLSIALVCASACAAESMQTGTGDLHAGMAYLTSLPASETTRGGPDATHPSDTSFEPGVASTHPAAPQLAPSGFPIVESQILGKVLGSEGHRTLNMQGGPSVQRYSEVDQVSQDPVVANASGWNCRTHVEYEGRPAVDWYVPMDTPVRATMDGVAALFITTTSNSFDFYGASREPYLGSPERSMAAVAPFPGASGGKGVFVEVKNEAYATFYAHLDLSGTVAALRVDLRRVVPLDQDSLNQFSDLRSSTKGTFIVSWPVHSGDVIGATGDTGYSEAPHLHYAILELNTGQYLCPTAELGFSNNAWLDK